MLIYLNPVRALGDVVRSRDFHPSATRPKPPTPGGGDPRSTIAVIAGSRPPWISALSLT